MTDDQRPDDADQTQRHDVPLDPPATPAVTPLTPGLERYSPPADGGPVWSRHDTVDQPIPTMTPERWYEPAPPVTAAPVAAPGAAAGRSSRSGAGTILAAALLSAALASGGTVIALGVAGPWISRPRSRRRPPARPSRPASP